MRETWVAIAVGIVAALALVSVAVFRLLRTVRRLRSKLAPILSVETEAQRLAKESAERLQHAQAKVAELEHQREALAAEYAQGREVHERLKAETALLEENLEDISFGVYRPHFTFDTSEAYRNALEKLTAIRRKLIHDRLAIVAPQEWRVNDSKQEGARLMRQYSKLLLRAFNGECDAALGNVSWNNFDKMEARLLKSYDAINELGVTVKMSIAPTYRDVRLSELKLTFEMKEKLYQEREEQRRARAAEREEEQVQRELEKARVEAERDAAKAAAALEKARAEVASAAGSKLDALNARIGELEAELTEAQQRGERAVSQAQLTKTGHVYIISNVGAFGQRVVKIGLTRRLDPMERIHELGDASVPFPFDVHALLYSADAPALETDLHNFVWERRLNLVNPRKEFFEATLDELEQYLKSKGYDSTFTKIAEAREYRQSVAIRAQEHTPESAAPPPDPSAFPQQLFVASSETTGAAESPL